MSEGVDAIAFTAVSVISNSKHEFHKSTGCKYGDEMRF
jgi:hypothetical protein